MATETVPVPLETLRAIQNALGTANEVTGAVRAICEHFGTESAEMSSAMFAVEACIARQEEPICSAFDLLDQVPGAAA